MKRLMSTFPFISSKLTSLLILICLMNTLSAQVSESEKRYVRIGSLQSHFSAYGSERAWNNVYYEGLIWPADYLYQDNAVIKRAWLAAKDFTDADGRYWDTYGIYFRKDHAGLSLFPMELKQTARFEQPRIYVDSNELSAPYEEDIDDYDPNQIPDRIVTNVVNTSMGLTMTRRVLAFSQQYHDNYFVKEFIFKNTGNTDWDDDIELNDSLRGVRIGWGTRYSVSREGAIRIDGQQSWGKHTWVTRRGETYPEHTGEVITEANSIVDWIRCGFSWFGQTELVSFDNIGAPYVSRNGRLTAPHFAGSAVLHVDKSASDREDNPYQPAVLGWHAGDSYPSVGQLRPSDLQGMIKLYDFLSGNPYPAENYGGTDRMDETYLSSIVDPVDPYTIHNDGGGTNVWITYGPFDLAPGDSIVIVEAEGISGLNRQMCEEIGARWKQAYDNPSDRGPFALPDGSTTTNNKDIYKNSWVYTGMDSILLTFSRAKRNYDSRYNIPQPPQPTTMFNVESAGDRILLSWAASPSEDESSFAGYKIYRAVGKPDTAFNLIAELPPGVTSYDDESPIRGFSYYYYIVAVNDGSNNTSGITNPTGPLHSSRFYTKTNQPAYLLRYPGEAMADIRVVPNPFNILARHLQYTEEDDKIMFLNIPGKCTIKIFSERGDLIETIKHTDGSGDESWNSISSSRQVVVSGIYIAHFEVDEDQSSPEGEILYRKGDATTRKIIIVR